MATQVQQRRGTTSQHSTFTGATAEITVDIDKKTVVVHDGSTAGGVPLAKEINVNTALTLASAAFDRANSSNDVLFVSSSFNTANAAYDFANGVSTNTTAAFDAANNISLTPANNYAGVMANSVNAYTSATYATIVNAASAFSFANGVATNTTAAFAAANTKLSNGSVMINGSVRPLALNETKTAPSISAGTLTLDCSTGNIFNVSLNANITTLTFSNVPTTGTAYSLTLAFTADGTARTVTWGGSVKWPSATAPTLTSTNGKVDIFILTTWDGGTTWYALTSGQNL